MELFGRRSGQETGRPVPEWASFFTPRQYREFVEYLELDLARRGFSYQSDDYFLSIGVLSGPFEGFRLGFSNLAQNCVGVPRRKWRALIRNHLDRFLSTAKERESETRDLDRDFEQAKPRLKIRLYPEGMPGIDGTVSRNITEGVEAALVYDLPDSVVGVSREVVESWDRPVAELFEVALANVRAEPPIDSVLLPAEGGAEVFGIIDDGSLFAATRALFLESYMPPGLELGAIAAIPNRHAVLYYPIASDMTFRALQTMIPAAMAMYQNGPGSISPYVYWWHDGVFQRQPTEVKGGRIHFSPMEEFIFQVLNRIRPV